MNEQGEELRSALTRAAREPFVVDAACPAHTVDGDELSGCCRAGVCGVDTQPWSRSAASFGLVLPRACLDPREAAELAEEPESRVTWEIEPQEGGFCLLTVTHDQLDGSPKTAESVSGTGWMMVLSGLKTLLETGDVLDPDRA